MIKIKWSTETVKKDGEMRKVRQSEMEEES
jgi:hypothetical protein